MTAPETSTAPLAEPGETIRSKWLMDESTTLLQAAERLEAEAGRLRELHEAGWTLQEPVTDDYGFLVDPDGNAGREDDDDE